KKNGVMIYESTQQIMPNNPNGDALVFPVTGAEFCADGSQDVTFELIFGLAERLSTATIGYDDVCIRGICGTTGVLGDGQAATCGAGGGDNGTITLTSFEATDRYDLVLGGTYTGTATYATATPIPTSGVVADTIPLKDVFTPYTVRIFKPNCYQDVVVTIPPTFCPYTCPFPDADVNVVPATCNGNTPNDDVMIQVTNATNATRIGISLGQTYTGPDYNGADPITGGAFTFMNMMNPSCSEFYTIRLFNGDEDVTQCIADITVTVPPTSCNGCNIICASVQGSLSLDPSSTNNSANTELCKTNDFVDLELTKVVDAATGATCNTDFTFTITVQNTGTMAATDITIADDFPPLDMMNTMATPSKGTFSTAGGWMIDELVPNETATLELVFKVLREGTFENCAYVIDYYPQNDPDSSADNDQTANEDDDSCVSVTATGKIPELTKSFSPSFTRPNVPVRMTFTIDNKESMPVEILQDFVDDMPLADGTGQQMTIANPPNLTTNLAGVQVAANGTQLVIPQGVILPAGLSTVTVDVNPPVAGDYVNGFAVGQLVTSAGSNCIYDDATLQVNEDFVLAPQISKSVSPECITVGQTAMLTIDITNLNNQAFTLVDDFFDNMPSGLVLASGGNTGTCLGVLSFNAGDDLITLPAGSTIPAGGCTIVVPVTASTSGNYCNVIGINSLVVSLGSVTGLGNEDRSEACLKVTNDPVFDLALRKTLAPGQLTTVEPGDPVNYEITVFNQGTTDATNVQVTDYLPSGLSLGTTTEWTMSGGNVVLVNPITTISPGQAVILNLPMVVDAGFRGTDITNVAEISSADGGTDIDSTPDDMPTNDDGGQANSPSDNVILGNGRAAGGAPGDANGLTDEDDADPAQVMIMQVCTVSLTATPGACNPADNTYSVSGEITY
ncbi:MAG: DUF11 domain-containing protein, partial [Bacteroidetes bacterium]